jgi:hypothetical protein
MVPKQQGVKALYCLQQMVAQQLQQQHEWNRPKADTRLLVAPSRTRPMAAAVSSLFMGGASFLISGANGPGILLMAGARPCSRATIPAAFRPRG